ncbi:hypothetical protein L2E82_24768 [Cichorium intybus]|uniref:Uncharacterized protein n=1 Tax=Cichorium intybus TaxID=13427 RepID=A0ACB9E1N9_CICIN|nr:hypothetical protein L2E82_24768 [Cichorium intybus]
MTCSLSGFGSLQEIRSNSRGSPQFQVHGAWVSGKRIQPGVPVKLKEGDTMKMGGSSRIYELHWVPLSQAFDVDDPFVPATFIKQQETQDENSSYLEILQTNSSNDENSTKEKPFFVLKCSKSCCGDTETEHSTISTVSIQSIDKSHSHLKILNWFTYLEIAEAIYSVGSVLHAHDVFKGETPAIKTLSIYLVFGGFGQEGQKRDSISQKQNCSLNFLVYANFLI